MNQYIGIIEYSFIFPYSTMIKKNVMYKEVKFKDTIISS